MDSLAVAQMVAGAIAKERQAIERRLKVIEGRQELLATTADASTTEGAAAPAVVEEFAVIEVFGHRRLVGRVQEVEKFGAKFLQIDVPNDGDFAKGFVSQLYGGSAIFSVTPCSAEYVARLYRPRAATGLLEPPAQGLDDDDDGPAF